MVKPTPDLVGATLVSLRRGELYTVVGYEDDGCPCLWLRSAFKAESDPGAWAAHTPTLADYDVLTDPSRMGGAR